MKGDGKYVKQSIGFFIKKENNSKRFHACGRIFVCFGTVWMLLLHLSSAAISRSIKNERIGI